MSKNVTFKISRIDTLGQGVSFGDDDKVTFIPKTLPFETGVAEIQATKGKKVQFAKLKSINTISDSRIEPHCAHYDQCQGCSYLHTNYENEKELKKKSYSFLFRHYIEENDITFTEAPRRFQYRNRIQLHYDKKKREIGYKSDQGILQVPQCHLPHPVLQKKLLELYQEGQWLKLVQNEPATGHIELSLKEASEEKISIAINQRYAHDGFTQVFEEMNTKVINSIDRYLGKIEEGHLENGIVIDLFGGNGNLTQNIGLPTLVVDYYTKPKFTDASSSHQSYFSLNIYDKNAISQLQKKLREISHTGHSISWLVVDPPRSGIKNLDQFVEILNPKRISYLSCNPNTQARDISPLLKSGWKIDQLEFLDLFPGTYHLESLVHLVRE